MSDTKEVESTVPVKPDIHQMKLHEYITFNGANVLRVPGGWLYSVIENYEGQSIALPPVFIPYNEEFKLVH